MKEFKDESFSFDIKDTKIKPTIGHTYDFKSCLTAFLANTITFFNIAALSGISITFYSLIPSIAWFSTLGIGKIIIKMTDFKRKEEIKEKLERCVNKLKKYGINVSIDNLKNSFLQVDNRNPIENKVNIYFFDEENKLKLLQERISYQKELNEYVVKNSHLYILNEKEIDNEIKCTNKSDKADLEKYISKRKGLRKSKYNNLFSENIKIFSNKFIKKHFRKILLTFIPAIALSYASLKKEYGNLDNINTTRKILNYYDDSNSLNDKEINNLLEKIEKEIKKVSDDDKFSIDNIDTKEEIENYLLLNSIAINQEMTDDERYIFYNYLDFFNDNPHIDKKKIYNRIANLDFIREDVNDIAKSIANENAMAFYNPIFNKIFYIDKCNDIEKAHEAAHVITFGYNLPLSLTEGLADIIVSEYFSEEKGIFSSCYCRNIAITKIAIELTSKDIILKSFGENSTKPISDKLIENQINNGLSYEEANRNAYEFLNDLNVSFSDQEIDVSSTTPTELDIFYPYYKEDSLKKVFIESLETDFYKAHLPNNNHYYFNEKEKVLTKK